MILSLLIRKSKFLLSGSPLISPLPFLTVWGRDGVGTLGAAGTASGPLTPLVCWKGCLGAAPLSALADVRPEQPVLPAVPGRASLFIA